MSMTSAYKSGIGCNSKPMGRCGKLPTTSHLSLPLNHHSGRVTGLHKRRELLIVRAEESSSEEVAPSSSAPDLGRDLSKITRTTAATFAPRSSTATKNPAVRGSVLYNVFEVQAWVAVALGGLLSFNILLPSEQPDIPRLMGMWSVWMFTIPSLRAKECFPREKDALNILFVAMPLMNVILPLIWRSFPFVFVSDVVLLGGVYAYKGVWREVYGLPLGPEASEEPKVNDAVKDATSQASE